MLLALPAPAIADEPNRAGFVVQSGDEVLLTRCVSFDEEEISGADLLALSGVEVVVDASRGMGITVCQIEGQGCAYPGEPCFCQCMGGGECAYWNYFYRDPHEAAWTYSALGALLRAVRPGSVEAWVWGDGHTPPADDLTFAVICASPTPALPGPAPADTAEAPTSVPVDATANPTDTPAPSPSMPSLPTDALPPPASVPPAPTGAVPNLSDYWPFGLLVLGLVLVGAMVRRRRG